MTAATTSLARARANLVAVDSATRHTISTASFAFGGHISRGLLKRGRSASSRYNAANQKYGRAQLFARLAELPNLFSYRVTAENWQEVSEIIYKMTLWADLGDRYDYREASCGWGCWEKIEAARHFVDRYAGANVKKQLRRVLEKEAA